MSLRHIAPRNSLDTLNRKIVFCWPQVGRGDLSKLLHVKHVLNRKRDSTKPALFSAGFLLLLFQ